MKRACLSVACLIALLAMSCGRRQTTPRIVFVSSTPSPAPVRSPEAAGVLTVAEPPQPEPEEEPAPPSPEPPEKPRSRPRVRLAPPDPTPEPEPEPTPAVDVPILEPLGGPADQAGQRQQVVRLQEQVRARIARHEKIILSAEERRMLGDARTFLFQSDRALGASDFQRALTLVRKASMLLAVIEQQ